MPIPPGQTLTRKFPVVGEKSPPPEALDLQQWRLRIELGDQQIADLDWPGFLSLPQKTFRCDIHCVTSWTRLGMAFTGIPLRELFHQLGVVPNKPWTRFIAYSYRHHDTSLPTALAMTDAWLVHQADGAPLSPAHGYPLRVVTPSRYFYKSLKWLHRIQLLDQDKLGFWERSSAYHNQADPWQEQRFHGRQLAPNELEAFKQATDFQPYRSQVILKADLSGWKPRTPDLRRIQLKACQLRRAELASCDLAGANLTLCQFQAAQMESANLPGADLEGANFTGAHLARANLRNTSLSAARFFTKSADGPVEGLRSWDGMTLEGATGLLEDQVAYLNGLGLLD